MFGLSLAKILLTALVIAGVWVAARKLGRLADRADRPDVPRRRPGAPRETAPDVEDMVRCGVCGDYVAARAARACGRADCPYPG